MLSGAGLQGYVVRRDSVHVANARWKKRSRGFRVLTHFCSWLRGTANWNNPLPGDLCSHLREGHRLLVLQAEAPGSLRLLVMFAPDLASFFPLQNSTTEIPEFPIAPEVNTFVLWSSVCQPLHPPPDCLGLADGQQLLGHVNSDQGGRGTDCPPVRDTVNTKLEHGGAVSELEDQFGDESHMS